MFLPHRPFVFCIVLLLQLSASPFARCFLNQPKTSFTQTSKSFSHPTIVHSSYRNRSSSLSTLSKLLSWFQGDFDNYNQVFKERQAFNMTPREGGGHEHIHCTLVPLQASYFPIDMFESNEGTRSIVASSILNTQLYNQDRGVVLAIYYLDGQPHRIFRIRLYTLFQDESFSPQNSHPHSSDNKMYIRMKLYVLKPPLENKIRRELNVSEWESIIYQSLTTLTTNVSNTHSTHLHAWDDHFTELPRCDVIWMSYPDPVRHNYFTVLNPEDDFIDSSESIHAYMIYDIQSQGVTVESQTTPGLKLRIQDELSLWENHLWINDRGYELHSNKLVYGNWKGIPYKMERVSSFRTVMGDDSKRSTVKERHIMNPSLEWTLIHSSPV